MPEKEFSPEQKETFQEVELEILNLPGKNSLVYFNGETEATCRAYNVAIGEILKELDLGPRHQMGIKVEGPHMPGEHGWEIYKQLDEYDEEKLESLFPRIHERAKKEFERYRDLYVY